MFGPDDAFLTTILKLLRQLPVYPMFGRGLTRLQPAYVEDVAEAIGRTMQRAETPSTIFEFGGPRVYSYEEFLGAVAHQAGLAPRLIPIPFAVWHALARVSETFPSPLLTRNQVELMQIDTVSSPDMPGFVELGISPHWRVRLDVRPVVAALQVCGDRSKRSWKRRSDCAMGEHGKWSGCLGNN
jgi:NADH dehydrogenase